MKNKIVAIFIFAILFMSASLADGQTALKDLDTSEYFDFWLGKWELTWEEGDGSKARGSNCIERVLDGKVIKENFEALTGQMEGFIGKSYSVYNANTGKWRQTWVDNKGGYLDFVGDFKDDKRIFKRKDVNLEGEEIAQRMVFFDIEKNSFTWDWEYSDDGGKSWELRWRIHYRRVESD